MREHFPQNKYVKRFLHKFLHKRRTLYQKSLSGVLLLEVGFSWVRMCIYM